MSFTNYIRSIFRKKLGIDVVKSKGKYLMLGGKRFTPMQAKLMGRTVHVHDNASYNLCLQELFEEEMYKFKAKNNKPYIIDCGANLGMSVLYFKQLYPEAEVLAFEADDEIFKYLEKNVASFDLKDVTLVNKAVWDKEETLSFLAEGGAGGRVGDEGGNHVYKKVPAIRLREFLYSRKVDFLKIDIEGAEYRVLKDCADLIKDIDNLFIEYHSMPNEPQTLHEILQMVADAGFRYQIKGAFAAEHPFDKQDLNFGMDLQLNIFCYKVHN